MPEFSIGFEEYRDVEAESRKLHEIAEAGFTHIMYGAHWYDDVFYCPEEIAHLKGLLRETGVKLLDIHGSHGPTRCLFSPVEFRRRMGVASMINRLEAMVELEGCGTVMVHTPKIRLTTTEAERPPLEAEKEALLRSVEELAPVCEKYGIPVTFENIFNDKFEVIEAVLQRFPPSVAGLCYDSGHGNVGKASASLDALERNKDRLFSVHIHDNNGMADQHLPPFMGTVNWERFAKLVAESAYHRPLNFECSMHNTTCKTYREFLDLSYERAILFQAMVDKYRQK